MHYNVVQWLLWGWYHCILLGLCKSAGDKRDYVYLIALGFYRLQVLPVLITMVMWWNVMQEYGEAMKFIDTTLAMEPNNSQAKELKQLIKQKQDRGQVLALS